MKRTKKEYKTAPLPFQGQKRNFARQFTEVIKEASQKGKITTIVDLFGGSGLLSRIAKDTITDCRVIYNDYDDYHKRIEAIPYTNTILKRIRSIIGDGKKNERLENHLKIEICNYIEECGKNGFVDYITLSGNILFSGRYIKSLAELRKDTLYNKVTKSDYSADGYLEGIEVVKADYKELVDKYKNIDGVLFVCDPPYLSTDTKSYNSDGYWKLKDYLNVLKVLQNTNYIYFTSEKSELIELSEWLADNATMGNVFADAQKVTRINNVNHSSSYMDIMMYKVGNVI